MVTHSYACTHSAQPIQMVGDLPQCLNPDLALQKKKKKLVMHTLTFLFPDSLAERTSCGSWLHNHANTTHLEPNKVSLSQTTHTLNSCTMHFAKTIHPNVIPGQQQLTKTLITWHKMWASHIHNIPLPQHDASIEIKTKTESSRWHQWNAKLWFRTSGIRHRWQRSPWRLSMVKVCNTSVCLWL